ncbi:MAG TPA: ABC transporter permease [Propionibacteriaceae bacterium]|nr:ABC transporter permease [Propionibacteriaceae bacterium]
MNALSGTRALLGLNIRRDKILLPVNVATFAAVAAGSAAATVGVYPDLPSRVQGSELINATPALVVMYGRVYDPTSVGAISMIKMIGMGTVMVGLFALMVVIRHTRADEELGRLELVAAGSVGRYAPLAAAVVVAVLGSVLIGLTTALALIGTGLDVVGSLAFGTSWAVAGIAFAGVGAVAAQLTAGARAARGLAIGGLAVAFVLRAAGDTMGGADPSWPTWLSPIGWSQQMRPFAGNRWWVTLLPLALAVALIGSATWLLRYRDAGAGMLPQRAGPARAVGWLGTPLGLAWRLQRAAFLGWLSAFVLLSFVAGQIVSSIGELLDSPVARQLITALGGVDGVADAFISVELSFVAVFASAYGISAALRLSGEEASLRGDLVLAGTVGRMRWAVSHLIIAMAGTGLLMLACGVALGLSHAAQSRSPDVLGSDLVAAVVRLPAIWVLVGLTVALYGLSRRVAPVAWGVLVATFLVSEIGPLLDLPKWVRQMSPFSHLPALPGGELAFSPLLVLLAIAAVLVMVGLAGVRRRDIAVG